MKTRKVIIQDVRNGAIRKPDGYFEDVLSHAMPNSLTPTTFDITVANWDKLDTKYRKAHSMTYKGAPRVKAVQRPIIYNWRLAGDFLAIIIQWAIGVKATAHCGCHTIRVKMNKLGWWRCLRNYKQEIAKHITKQAKGLVGAKIKEYRTWRQTTTE
jgi:hypothetical protein